ncbi:MAG: tryptophan synthase subunit alpha [Phycisphaerales bacterium]|nr:MAG: tryptophan synthase subunit alpha [Phycisphaerales bacterium]
MHQNRIDQKFSELAGAGRKALIPYLTAGYPDLSATGRMLRQIDALGVPLVELGIPFSDSIADGPVIQGSFHRVLGGTFRVAELFDLVRSLRANLSAGLLAMVSMSIVRRNTVPAFVDRCKASGFDGLIVPDMPLEEASDVFSVAADAGLRSVMLVAPTTPAPRCGQIARASGGFVYQVAVRGITGERDELPARVAEYVGRLRQVSHLPVCVGFGISTSDQVRAVCKIADGAIVGSAVVRRITEGIDAGRSGDDIADAVTAFVADLLKGTVPA